MKKLTLIAATLAITGCANTGANFVPIVDGGHGSEKYQTDLYECQSYARELASAGESAAAGAAAGAVFGALLSAAVGGSRSSGAWVGALSGGVSAAGHGERDQRTVVSRCLAGRGWRVLN